MPRTCRPLLLALAVLGWSAGRADAAFVVVANFTEQELKFAVLHPTAQPRGEAVGPGEIRIIPVGRRPELEFEQGGRSVRYRLDPYTAYAFTARRNDIKFQGIELAGPLPKPDDVPAEPPPPAKPLRLSVKVLVDDVEPRTRAVWEKAVRERVAAASAILERQCGVALDVAAVDEWASDPEARDVPSLLKDFERKVKPAPARVAVGFSSRVHGSVEPDKAAGCNLGLTHGPLSTHVLIRENGLRAEAERVEVLVHEVAHLVGAAHSPDQFTAMRPRLGDGKARAVKFRIRIDPLNLLAVGIWVEELRGGKVRGWGDLSQPAQERLTVIYKTLAHALPDDSVATDYLVILDRQQPMARAPVKEPMARKADDPEAIQPPRPAGPVMSPRDEAVRKIVRAVALRAADLSRLPAADRPKGDALTTELIRTAASVAVTQEDAVQVPAFLIGLGIALDDSTILRNNPLTRDLCRRVESDEERRERVAALGVPTVRHRRDLCQHFAVSAALTELVGPAGAETAGLLKEQMDMNGTSGFSFTDLAADFAGVAFAKKLKADPGVLPWLRDNFKVEHYVPAVSGLREGLSRKRFEADYGSADDARCKAALDEVRKRVADLPAYKK